MAGRGLGRFLSPLALTLALVAETLQRAEILAYEFSSTLAGLGILGLPFLARGLSRRMNEPSDAFGRFVCTPQRAKASSPHPFAAGGNFVIFVVVFTLLFVLVDFSPGTRQGPYWPDFISALIVGAFIVRGGFHLQSAIGKRVELTSAEDGSSP